MKTTNCKLILVALMSGIVGSLLTHLMTRGIGTAEADQPRQDQEKIVTAEKFVLTDKDGNTKMLLNVEGNRPGIHFYDSTGKHRLWVGISTKDRPAIRLKTKDKKAKIQINLEEDGSPKILMWDKDGKQVFSKP